jgi:dihydropteroate synthase
MREALRHGASMINDIYGCACQARCQAVAESDCAVCLMHMQGEPLTMQQQPSYRDVVGEVAAFLRQPRQRGGEGCRDQRRSSGARPGVRLRQDAGAQSRTAAPPRRVVAPRACRAGGNIAQVDARCHHRRARVGDRLAASIAAAVLAAQRGARIPARARCRTDTRDALAVWQAVDGRRFPEPSRSCAVSWAQRASATALCVIGGVPKPVVKCHLRDRQSACAQGERKP